MWVICSQKSYRVNKLLGLAKLASIFVHHDAPGTAVAAVLVPGFEKKNELSILLSDHLQFVGRVLHGGNPANAVIALLSPNSLGAVVSSFLAAAIWGAAFLEIFRVLDESNLSWAVADISTGAAVVKGWAFSKEEESEAAVLHFHKARSGQLGVCVLIT